MIACPIGPSLLQASATSSHTISVPIPPFKTQFKSYELPPRGYQLPMGRPDAQYRSPCHDVFMVGDNITSSWNHPTPYKVPTTPASLPRSLLLGLQQGARLRTGDTRPKLARPGITEANPISGLSAVKCAQGRNYVKNKLGVKSADCATITTALFLLPGII